MDPNQTVEMVYGSGAIDAVVATDLVQVGGLTADMKDGVLLMVDRAKLEITGGFGGILGLGNPYLESYPALVQAKVNHSVNPLCAAVPDLCRGLAAEQQQTPGFPDNIPEVLFMQQAKVDRYTLCINAMTNGALRMNVPPFADPIPNIGVAHWGLALQGVTMGKQGHAAPTGTPVVCGPDSYMAPGQISPCGFIPDSGTTVIMGPQEQIDAIEADACAQWDRCVKFSEGNASAHHFRKLLRKCGEWLDSVESLEEIPSMFFTVGSATDTRTFELTPAAWIIEGLTEDYQVACEPALDGLDYYTQENGPVWIFGMPIFYEYTMGYDLENLAISLEKGECDVCASDAKQEFFAAGAETKVKKSMRRQTGKPRIPFRDTKLPL